MHLYKNVQAVQACENIPFKDILGMIQGKFVVDMNGSTHSVYNLIEKTQKARETGKGSEEYARLKKSMPAVTIHAYFRGARKISTSHDFTNVLMFDFDNIPETDMKTVIEKCKSIPEVRYCFMSLSGQGLHLLVKVENLTDENFKEVYLVLGIYLSYWIGYDYDTACSDITRLMILNHDPNLYINKESTIVDANKITEFNNFLNHIFNE